MASFRNDTVNNLEFFVHGQYLSDARTVTYPSHRNNSHRNNLMTYLHYRNVSDIKYGPLPIESICLM